MHIIINAFRNDEIPFSIKIISTTIIIFQLRIFIISCNQLDIKYFYILDFKDGTYIKITRVITKYFTVISISVDQHRGRSFF